MINFEAFLSLYIYISIYIYMYIYECIAYRVYFFFLFKIHMDILGILFYSIECNKRRQRIGSLKVL